MMNAMNKASPVGRDATRKVSKSCNFRQPLGWLSIALVWISLHAFAPSLVAQFDNGTAGRAISGNSQQPNDQVNSESLELAEQRAFQAAVSVVAPSVVQIETFGGLERLDDRTFAEGPITGTIIDEQGWIVTSLFSLYQQPASILVNLPDGTRAPAKIVARDFSRELALLKVETDVALPVATVSDPESWRVGQWSIAVGKTYDTKSVTQSFGIVSALGRAYGRAVQTDAKVSPINYGGPLIDLFGRVIGILTPVPAGEMLGEDGSVLYDSGIGFAVPLADIVQRLPTMQSGQDIRAGKLGIVTEDQNEMAGPVKLSGAAPGSPADKAGVQAGDIIVSALGQKIELLADLRHQIATLDAGQLFQFEVLRDEEVIPLECELAAEIPVYRRRYLGIQVQPSSDGLQVRSVIDASPASSAGLEVGQIITHCDGKEIVTRSDLLQLLSVADLERPLQLTIRAEDGQAQRQVEVTLAKWPERLMEHQPPSLLNEEAIDGQAIPGNAVEVTELKLADMPNKIHAIIPQNRQSQPLGCLLVYSEPGELSPEKLKANWEKLSNEFGWIIVFPASANPQSWTRDEVELASRLLTRLDQEYSIDPSRIAIGGIGVGGQLALITALMDRERVRGVFTLGTKLRQIPIRQPSAPLQTLDLLFVGDRQLESVVEQVSRLGYVANWITAEIDSSKWESVPFDSLTRWLELLGYL